MGGWALVHPCRVLVHCEVLHHSTSVKGQNVMLVLLYILLKDNSDSPSIVEQLWQDVTPVVIPLLVIVPSSMMYPKPYACQLASCSMGISNYASHPDLMTLHSLCPCSSCSFCLSHFSCLSLPGVLQSLFIQGVFLLNPGIACLTKYPGIACLAFQASYWVGVFWGNLSGLLIGHPFVRCPSKCDPC